MRAAEPGKNITGVLVATGNDLVAPAKGQPTTDDIGAFGGIAGKGDLVGGAAEQIGGLAFDDEPVFVVLATAVFSFECPDALHDRIDDDLRRQAESAGIEKGQVGSIRVLGAQGGKNLVDHELIAAGRGGR